MPDEMQEYFKTSKIEGLLHRPEFLLVAFEHVFTNVVSGIMITDSDGTILDVSPGFTKITGYSREEAIGQNSRFLRSFYQNNDFYKNMWNKIKAEGYFQAKIWNRRKSGEVYPEVIAIRRIDLPETKQQYFMAVFSELQFFDKDQSELNLAYYDLLTEIPNRILLLEHLSKIKQNIDHLHAICEKDKIKKKLVLFFFDLNKFKTVNDTYGHLAGDKLLKAAVTRLKKVVRETDLLARVGGDEFVLVSVLNSEKKNVIRVCNRIKEEFSKSFKIDGIKTHQSVSIGVAWYPEDAQDVEVLIQHADMAMYIAKQKKKDYAFYQDLTDEEKNAKK